MRERPSGAMSPIRAKRPPPRKRGMAGPLVFTVIVLALVAVLVGQGQAFVADLVVGMVSERDTLLRQAPIRAIVAGHVGPATDIALDPAAEMRDFEVKRGETASVVADRLVADKLVRTELAFLVATYDEGVEAKFQAGAHRVSAAMTPREIAKALSTQVQEQQTTLRIIEGWRLTEIAAEVNKRFPHITSDAFTKAAVVGKRPSPAIAGLDEAVPLEGFLYPDTYFFKTDATVETIITTLLDTFEKRAGETLRAAATKRKTTVYDLVKLASLVEREARARDESARIAGVYANRLSISMKLDADPTIQYALGKWRPLTLEDLKIDSPYNTYRVAGLPPTPIANPGLAALRGAADPEDHEFLFFVANEETGRHLFAKTLEEHEANRVKVGNR